MKTTQHLGCWLLLATLGFFASPLLRSGPVMEELVRSEIEQTRAAIGPALTHRVLMVAETIARSPGFTLLAAGLTRSQHTSEEARLSERVAGPAGGAVSRLYNSYLRGLRAQTYVASIRGAVVLFWCVALLPLMMASVHDGVMQRKVKQAEFGAIRPATFTFAGLMVIPMTGLPLLYLVLPIAVSPMLAPAWAALTVLPLAVMVANSQPLFGR